MPAPYVYIRLTDKELAWNKHSSLICHSDSDDQRKFYTNTVFKLFSFVTDVTANEARTLALT
jgi:hypothetical protein